MAIRFDADEALTRTTGMPSGSTLSFCMWLKISTDRNTYSAPFTIDSNSGSPWTDYLALTTTSDGTTLTLEDNNGGASGISIVAMTVGTWYWVGVSVSGGTATIYYAAASAAGLSSTSGSMQAVTPGAIRVGRSSWTLDPEWWNGCVAALKIWDGVALSQAEMEAERWFVQPRRTTNLNSWYPFDAASNVDYGGGGYNLSAISSQATEDGPPVIWSTGRSRIYLPAASVVDHATSVTAGPVTDATTSAVLGKVTSTTAGPVTDAATVTVYGQVTSVTAAPVTDATTTTVTDRPTTTTTSPVTDATTTTAVDRPSAVTVSPTTDQTTATTVDRPTSTIAGGELFGSATVVASTDYPTSVTAGGTLAATTTTVVDRVSTVTAGGTFDATTTTVVVDRVTTGVGGGTSSDTTVTVRDVAVSASGVTVLDSVTVTVTAFATTTLTSPVLDAAVIQGASNVPAITASWRETSHHATWGEDGHSASHRERLHTATHRERT